MEIDPEEANGFLSMSQNFSALTLRTCNEIASYLFEPIQKINSNEYPLELEGVITIRKMLSARSPPCREVVEANILPSLLEMSCTRPEKFTHEVSWMICNIAAGDSNCVKYLLRINVLDFLNRHFNLASSEMKDQIFWTLGNIAADGKQCQSAIFLSPIFHKVLKHIETLTKPADKNLVWAVSNLSHITPDPEFPYTPLLENFFIKTLIESTNQEILIDACWGLFYITESSKFASIYTNKILKRIIELMTHFCISLSYSSTRIIGNIVMKTKHSWVVLKELGIVDVICALLDHNMKNVKKEALGILSNLCSEGSDVVSFVRSKGVYEKLLGKLACEEQDIKCEIIWTIANSVHCALTDDVNYIFDIGWVDAQLNVFGCISQPGVRKVLVYGLYLIFSKMKRPLEYAHLRKLKNCEGFPENNDEVLQYFDKLISMYGEDEDCCADN